MNSSTFRTRALRTLALTGSMVAVIAAVLFFSPTGRALADNVIRQFGGYIFVEGTPQPDPVKKEMLATAENRQKPSPEQEATAIAQKQQMKDQQQVKPNASGKPSDNFAPDAAAASQLAGFSVVAPSYIPDGYTPALEKNASGGWSVFHENGGVVAMTNYENLTEKGFIAIEQQKGEQNQPKTVERPQIVDVTVRGQPGAWMPEVNGKNTLAWDENGVTYLVVSNKLSMEESLKIAEGLAK